MKKETLKAWEGSKKDKALDKKMGWKEGGKKDMAMDRKEVAKINAKRKKKD